MYKCYTVVQQRNKESNAFNIVSRYCVETYVFYFYY